MEDYVLCLSVRFKISQKILPNVAWIVHLALDFAVPICYNLLINTNICLHYKGGG